MMTKKNSLTFQKKNAQFTPYKNVILKIKRTTLKTIHTVNKEKPTTTTKNEKTLLK